MPLLVVSHVSKVYPGLPVLHDVSFTADEGEIICLLGPSGVGKSTLLRIIAGLETADSGGVAFAGQDLAGVPVHRRHFGLMFQDYALFPHKDVNANVAFGLRMAGLPPAEIARRVGEMLALVHMPGYERRRVVELSGGEQQRVALARSLAPGPRLLMLDEPLGALDRTLRERLMNELRSILKGVGVTALYVTHDQEEAFAVADRVLIMRARLERGLGGHVEQAGTPQEVYRQPATRFVAQFLGFQNLVPGVVREALPAPSGLLANVETPLGLLTAGAAQGGVRSGERVTVLVRPEAASPHPSGAPGEHELGGRLVAASFRGGFDQVRVATEAGTELTFDLPATGDRLPAAGEPLVLWLQPSAVTLLPDEEGEAEPAGVPN